MPSVLEARSLKSSKAPPPKETPEENVFLVFPGFWWLAWHSWACGSVTPVSASAFPSSPLYLPSLCISYKDTSLDLGSTWVIQGCKILNLNIHLFWGFICGHTFLGASIPPTTVIKHLLRKCCLISLFKRQRTLTDTSPRYIDGK